jgi:hypothetical protein
MANRGDTNFEQFSCSFTYIFQFPLLITILLQTFAFARFLITYRKSQQSLTYCAALRGVRAMKGSEP